MVKSPMGNPKKRASSASSKPRKLTPQRENFARHVAMGFSGAESYRRSYVVEEDTKQSTVWNEASKLLATPEVAARVAQLNEIAAQKTAVTRESMLVEMGHNRTIALDSGKLSVAATSSMQRARVAKLLDKEPPPPPPAAPEDAPDMVNAELSQEERTLNAIGRRVFFTLELGKRRGKDRVKLTVEENKA